MQPIAPSKKISRLTHRAWKKHLARFETPSGGRAIWQIINSVIPYGLTWIAMIHALAVSFWLMLPLGILASGFLARIFIIFHDCGHGSFFKSKSLNHLVGSLAGLLTFTPYRHWRWQHAQHHGTSSNLDKRGAGDLWTLTVQEFRDASTGRRIAYRLARNPVILFLLAPLYIFVVYQRFSAKNVPRQERLSVHLTNGAIVTVAVVLSGLIGFKAYAVIQLTVLYFTGVAAIWLFYVQHQFADAYWERSARWNYETAALEGSSYYQLPKWLQWFTGNIGFHHIHHLSPRIPNYHLQRCHDANALFHPANPVTFLSSLRALNFRLWDEDQREFVGYRASTIG